MKAFKGIGSQLVLSFAVAVCVAIILVSLGSIRITKTSINANTEVTSEQTLDNVQEGFTTYLKTLSQPVDLLTRKNEIKHLEDQGELLLKSTSLVIESDNWLSRLCTSSNVLAIELPIWLIELSKSATLYPISSYISETEFIYP